MITKSSQWMLTLVVAMVIAMSASLAQAGLVAQYLFENNLNDNSGNGHTGTFLSGGGASFVNDPDRGNVLEIDGSAVSGVDIYGVVPIPDNAPNTSFTLAAWAKVNVVTGSDTEEYILQIGRNGNAPLVTLGIENTFFVRSYSESDEPVGNGDQVTVTSSIPVEDSAPFQDWHHVAVVHNRATDIATTYIDGLPRGTTDISFLDDTFGFTWSGVGGNAATIGTEGDLLGNSFDGRLDDIRFYDHALTDQEILEDVYAVPTAFPELHIDRNTGEMTLVNASNATGPMELQGYSITSTRGSLDQSAWNSIAENGDMDSGGSVDGNDNWSKLTQPGVFTDLSEFQFGGDGVSVAISDSLDLSDGARTWLPSPIENDIVVELAFTDGRTQLAQVVFDGNGGVPLLRSDLDHDGDIDTDDYAIFRANDLTDLSGLNFAQSYLLGDIDGDLDVDFFDFTTFGSDYDDANGAGSFQAMLSSVPEPTSCMLLGMGLLAVFGIRPRRRSEDQTTTNDTNEEDDMMAMRNSPSSGRHLSKAGKLATVLMTLTAVTVLLSGTAFAVSVNFSTYTLENYKKAQFDAMGPFDTSVPTTAAQVTSNGSQAVLFGSDDITNKLITGTMNPGGDDDILGFVLGFNAGDTTNLAADYMMLDWKRVTQNFNFTDDGILPVFHDLTPGLTRPAGLLMSRVSGTPTADELWGHADQVQNPTGGLSETVQASTLGTTGYTVDADVDFEILYTPDRIKVTVDGVKEFDVIGSFGSGGLGLMSGYMGATNLPVWSDFDIVDAPETMTARINEASGEVRITNTTAVEVSINAYNFDSEQGSLDTSNWNSLEDQDLDTIGGGEGQSWDEAVGSDASELGERFLLGTTTLAAGAEVSIGNAYNPGVGDANLKFVYNDPVEGDFHFGNIEFILLGDMDGNGTLEDADVNPFVQALTDRASYESNNPGVDADFVGDFNGNNKLDLGDVAMFKAAISALPGSASAGSVPEPSTCVLLGLALVGMLVNPSRRKRAA